MKLFKKSKPRIGAIDLTRLHVNPIIYCCKTQVMDKVIIERAGKEFNQKMADAMENRDAAFCFVVMGDLTCNVIPKLQIDAFKIVTISEFPPTKEQTQSKACFEHYIQSLSK